MQMEAKWVSIVQAWPPGLIVTLYQPILCFSYACISTHNGDISTMSPHHDEVIPTVDLSQWDQNKLLFIPKMKTEVVLKLH